jgi:hypothetical protein
MGISEATGTGAADVYQTPHADIVAPTAVNTWRRPNCRQLCHRLTSVSLITPE